MSDAEITTSVFNYCRYKSIVAKPYMTTETLHRVRNYVFLYFVKYSQYQKRFKQKL